MTYPNDTGPIDADFGAAPGQSGAVSQAEFAEWWARLPDFIKSDYPFDLPPARLPFAQFVFTEVGAPRLCPEAGCRLGVECRGGDGPPCYRADRKFLSHVLFLWWMRLYHGCTDEDYEASLRKKGSPYASRTEAPAAKAQPDGRRRKRRRR